uniref:Putative group i salivary lipocalin n=1 Tax=Rhipicephalus pulchellus TaxID=72859 RepID=L7LT39_RHIPC
MNRFAVVCILVLARADYSPAITFEEIFSALKTHEKIWVHRRSFLGESLKCNYNEKLLFTESHYVFNECYKSGNEIAKVAAHGKIYKVKRSGGFKSAMNVSTIQGSFRTYILQFWDPRELCGVLTFRNSSGRKECELHSRARVGRHFKNCMGQYTSHCKNEKYVEYVIDNVNCK